MPGGVPHPRNSVPTMERGPMEMIRSIRYSPRFGFTSSSMPEPSPPPIPSCRVIDHIHHRRRPGERVPWPDSSEGGRFEYRSRRREEFAGLRTRYFRVEVCGRWPAKLAVGAGGWTGGCTRVSSEGGRSPARARVAPESDRHRQDPPDPRACGRPVRRPPLAQKGAKAGSNGALVTA